MFPARPRGLDIDQEAELTTKDVPEAAPTGSARGLRRHISGVQLIWVSVGSIIGSGWLFSALFAAQVAGPSVVLTWIIGTAAVAVLALVFAELGGMFAVSGGTARFPHYAFGGLAGSRRTVSPARRRT